LLASLALTAGGLAACGDDDDTADTTVAPAAETTAAAAETTAAAADTTAAATDTTEAAAGTGLELTIAETDLGPVVADAEGKVLYIYTPDTGSESTCVDQCAENWPPAVSVGAPTAGEGIDDADIGTTTRADGDTQVTYYGHPLYYFAADLAPGDTTGQGVGDVWFVIDAEGNQIAA
jgi:predicted lipoprotein with Yx(FWY)xxD motif